MPGITGGAGAHYAVDTTGVPAVARNAMACVRLGGAAALVGAQLADLVLDTLAVVGKTGVWVLEGNADPKTFIPRLIELWQAGPVPVRPPHRGVPPQRDRRGRGGLVVRPGREARPRGPSEQV